MTDDELEEFLRQKEQRDSIPQVKERFYITNSQLLEELVKWRDSNKDEEQREYSAWLKLPKPVRDKHPYKPDYDKRTISEEFAKMFMQLAAKVSNHSYFRNYPLQLKQDMMGQAYLKFVTGVKKFNFKYTNAFAYLTQVCFNAFKTILAQHYKQVNIKRDKTKQAIVNLDAYMPNSSISKCLNNQFDLPDAEGWEES